MRGLHEDLELQVRDFTLHVIIDALNPFVDAEVFCWELLKVLIRADHLEMT